MGYKPKESYNTSDYSSSATSTYVSVTDMKDKFSGNPAKRDSLNASYRNKDPLVFYAREPVYGAKDGLARAALGYQGSANLQADQQTARKNRER